MEASTTAIYTYQDYGCAYELHQPTAAGIPLLLIHPIGVGLSRQFWQRFCREWQDTPIYNPDLLGCGESDMPHIAYTPSDWANQLQYFLENVVQKPVIVLVQGALLPVAIELSQQKSNFVAGLILSDPPAWGVMTKNAAVWRQKLIWNILDSPVGSAFYRYARSEKFLRSFSTDKLFATSNAVDGEWINTLRTGAQNLASRHAVFSFLARFWQRDYSQAIATIKQPTLVVMGDTASSVSQEGKQETPDQRLANYLACLPQGQGLKIPGRNVLPYESTPEFISAIAPFISNLHSSVGLT